VPCAIPFGKPIGELLLRTHLILIDEASMLNRSNVESLDVAFEHIPFGGKVVV
jgi:hypothetical protein